MRDPKLWLFGDSFSIPSLFGNKKLDFNFGFGDTTESFSADWQWSVILSEKLNTKLIVMAEYGVSNDWILLKFKEARQQFSPGDKVIVQATEKSRYLFFKAKPYVSNAHQSRDLSNILSKGEQDAITLYWKHFQEEDKDQLRVDAYFSYLNTMKWMLGQNNIDLIILPGFEHPKEIPIAGPTIEGTMQTISKGEFIDHNAALAWYAQPDRPDQRLNHMCKDNHVILADRLYEHIANKRTLDLAYGYNNSFLSIATQDAGQLNPEPIAIRSN